MVQHTISETGHGGLHLRGAVDEHNGILAQNHAPNYYGYMYLDGKRKGNRTRIIRWLDDEKPRVLSQNHIVKHLMWIKAQDVVPYR